MKSFEQDGGECQRKWHHTRLAKLLQLSGAPPNNLGIDEVELTVFYRYAESLMSNARISRYLGKHHPMELRRLHRLVDDVKKRCEWDGSDRQQRG
jgi:hypothetical protein